MNIAGMKYELVGIAAAGAVLYWLIKLKAKGSPIGGNPYSSAAEEGGPLFAWNAFDLSKLGIGTGSAGKSVKIPLMW